MSEILCIYLPVHESDRKGTGHHLFIDEINCKCPNPGAGSDASVSPGKNVGSHKVPDGWIVAAAGNPPEYNRSVRSF